MSWDSRIIPSVVWKIDGVRHTLVEWCNDGTYAWATLCESNDTLWTTSGGKKPRVFKGFVTCLQCLAKGDEAP